MGDGGDAGRNPRGRALSELGGGVRGNGLRAVRPGSRRRARPGVPRAAPRRVTGDRARPAQAGGQDRRPGSRLPAEGRIPLPDLVRRGAPRPPVAGRVRVRHPRALPRGCAGGRPCGRAGLLRHRRRARARAARAGRRHRACRRDRRRRQRRVGRGPADQARLSLPRGDRGFHRLRAAHASPHARDRAGHRRAGAVHAPPGADGAGHPRHVLRAARRRLVGRSARAVADVLRRRALRARD